MPQQKVGDVCESCREFWENQDSEPKVLQSLGYTEIHNTHVPACSHCDGSSLDVKKPKKKKKG